MPDDKQKHVVVLGAGFGGLTFCKSFRHPGARVTVVDRTNHHLFQPLLYQVAAAGLAAPDIARWRLAYTERERAPEDKESVYEERGVRRL